MGLLEDGFEQVVTSPIERATQFQDHTFEIRTVKRARDILATVASSDGTVY
jgi:hypothetical protein